MSKLRTTLPTLALIAMGGFMFAATQADTLDMSGGNTANLDDGRPQSGMSQAGVEAKYGAPAAKIAAVGDPPISRWEYQDFIVYFEYDKVIHTVLRR